MFNNQVNDLSNIILSLLYFLSYSNCLFPRHDLAVLIIINSSLIVIVYKMRITH